MKNYTKYLFGLVLILVVIVFAGSLFTSKDLTDSTNLVKGYTISQLPLVPGEPIHWQKIVALNQITEESHLLSVPGTASNIKVSLNSPSDGDLVEHLSPTEALANRQKLSALAKDRASLPVSKALKKSLASTSKPKGFWANFNYVISNLSSSMLATAEEALAEESSPEPIIVDLAPVVESELTTGQVEVAEEVIQEEETSVVEETIPEESESEISTTTEEDTIAPSPP